MAQKMGVMEYSGRGYFLFGRNIRRASRTGEPGPPRPKKYSLGISRIFGPSKIFPLGIFFITRLRCYGGVDCRLPNNLPLMPITLARLERDEPSASDQNFDRADRALPISDGLWAKNANLACGDDGFVPALEKVEQQLCGLLVRLFDRRFGWSSFAESFKEVDHCFLRPFVCLLR